MVILPLYTFIYADAYSEKEVGIKVNITKIEPTIKLDHKKKEKNTEKYRLQTTQPTSGVDVTAAWNSTV